MLNRKLFFMILYGLLCLSVMWAGTNVGTKPILAILEPTLENVGRAEGRIIYEFITDKASRTNLYVLTERIALDRVLKELAFASSDLVDISKARKIGQILGATHILLTTAIKQDDVIHLNLQIVLTGTGEIQHTAAVSTKAFINMERTVEAAVSNLLDIQLKKTRFICGLDFGWTYPLFPEMFSPAVLDTSYPESFSMSARLGLLMPLPVGRLYLGLRGGQTGHGFAIITHPLNEIPDSLDAVPLLLAAGYYFNLNENLFAFFLAEGGVANIDFCAYDTRFTEWMGYFSVSSGIGIDFYDLLFTDLLFAFDLIPFEDMAVMTVRPLFRISIQL